ncbi:MAG: GNAT family N-acetyltransferase [Flavobacteriales bacterium]|nr:GNAT family N-acetyltransferase [Flavobacteriales bacterium]
MDFKLRPWQMSDLDSLVRYANNEKIAKNLTNRFPHPYTNEDGKNFIEMASRHQPVQIFAIEINGEAAGGIGVHPQTDIHEKNMELGYWLAEPYWGNGIIPKAIIQMVDYAFQNFDIVRVFAKPFGTNLASKRVLEKAGFKFEAQIEKSLYKNGEFLDELIYAVRRRN